MSETPSNTKPHVAAPDDAHRVACLEVWGGNQPVETAASLAGLDLWVFSQPHGGGEDGGDVHLVSSCANGVISRVLLADVAGHGASADEKAQILRRIMRRYANQIGPERFLAHINRAFEAQSGDNDFATAVVCTFVASTRELTVALAGHPPALRYHAARRSWSSVGADDDADNLPLGLLADGGYSQRAGRLAPGDMLLCYTDAWIEADTPSGQQLGVAGLLDIVSAMDCEDPNTFLPRLRHAFLDRVQRDAALDNDDATLLLLRATGHQGSWVNRLLSTGRMLGAMVNALRPGGPPIPWPEWADAGPRR